MAILHYDEWGLAPASDGTQLFYGIRGHGAPLVFLDGIGCDGWAFKHIQPPLAQSYRTIHCHYRGHGRSGSPIDPKRVDISDLRDDVLSVLAHLQVKDVSFIAHSMGTQVVLETYRAERQRVRGMALVCGSYGRVTHTFHGNDILHRILPGVMDFVRRHRAISNALWGRLPPSLSYRVATMLGEVDGSTLDPNDFKEYVEHLSDIDLSLYLAMLEKAGEHSAADLLPEIAAPTLVIAAEKDTFTPREVVLAMARAIPHSEYLELHGASHAAPAEQPQRIVDAVSTFLQRSGY